METGRVRMKKMPMGDVWGGLSASALVLPQAMAFGITLWSPYTNDPAAAAMSGLVAAACLCVVSGLFRGTSGLVAAPTGPTLVLLAGAIAALAATGLTGDTLITATLFIVALAGVFQILIGGLKLGHLIKFIPYPVVSGFMTGSAILMIMSQSSSVLGGDSGLTMQQGAWVPIAAAGITLASMRWLPRWIKKVPGTVLGLVAGTLSFHAFSLIQGHITPTFWVVGSLPSIADLHFGFSLENIDSYPWFLIAGSALALAVLASLDTLLTAVIADVSTGVRHEARRELMGQGAGHILSALAGGMAGAGTTGATLVAIQSGGRVWAGLVTGIGMVLLILFMGPIAAVLPISVFAGIILHVAIFGMLDKDILRWLYSPQARIDGLIAVIVTGVTVSYDLMVAVGLGILLAAIEFIRTQVQSAVVQRRWTVGERTSLRRRIKKECGCLSKNAESIVGYNLKGILFFGTTDHLFDTMANDLEHATYIILDMRGVSQVDLTALRLIEHMNGMMKRRGGELILAHVPKSMGLVKREGHRHEHLVPYHKKTRLRTLADSDRALEYAEDSLLKRICGTSGDQDETVPFSDTELMSVFKPKEQDILEPFFKMRKLKKGDYIFRHDDFGEDLFVILAGQVEILLPYGKRKLRLASFGPGMTVGEIAFLEPGKRSADGRITADGEVAVFQHKTLKKLFKEHPDLGMRLLLRLGHDLSENLRMADAELRRLASIS